MKRYFALITLAASLVGGVAFLMTATKPAQAQQWPAQAQQWPAQCHDEMICTPINGCRWVTICR